MRYRPTAGSPLVSPERTERTYVRTRSSISETDSMADSSTSRSVTGCETVDALEEERSKSTVIPTVSEEGLGNE